MLGGGNSRRWHLKGWDAEINFAHPAVIINNLRSYGKDKILVTSRDLFQLVQKCLNKRTRDCVNKRTRVPHRVHCVA